MLMLINTLRMLSGRLDAVRDDETGGVAIEYALLAALIALAIAVGAEVLGDSISNFFDAIGVYLDGIRP